MKLERESVEDLKRAILRIIAKHLDLNEYKVFFFGSRVSGASSERSDIDVGIDGPQPIPFGVMSRIRDEIFDLPVLYRIDIIDSKRVSSDFREVALQHIQSITE